MGIQDFYSGMLVDVKFLVNVYKYLHDKKINSYLMENGILRAHE